MEKIHSDSLDIVDQVADAHGDHNEIILNYLKAQELNKVKFRIPKGMEWLQSSPLSMKILEGKIVLLDFFTYCCMNCLHILPFLHQLEKKYSVEKGLFVLGVHSAKFNNEKVSKNIENALKRYNITHPVINDCDVAIWDELLIKCWPTLVVLSPHGNILLALAGENHVAFVGEFIKISLEYYSKQNHISFESICEIEALIDNEDIETLKYPGNVAISSGSLIAISDTGHHRILVCQVNGRVKHIVGGLKPGNTDGNFETASFNNPQGVEWQNDNIVYVADCGNHAIRKIDLTVGRVFTICGTGTQGSDLNGGKVGVEQPLNSPWDVSIGGSPQHPTNDSILYIAMSGCHQIWALFLNSADWQKGVTHGIGECVRFAGNGNEENRNNSYPHKAAFAQPSGLTIDKQLHRMFVADSESSTIRNIELKNGAVKALVGGDIDPLNLFAYGDKDGKARDVRLQHPLSVAWDVQRNKLFVADTYNNKIKIIEPAKKICMTYDSSYSNDDYAKPTSDFDLSEPGSICIDRAGKYLYIADTNNHAVKVVNLEEGTCNKLSLKFMEDTVDSAISSSKNVVAKQMVSKRYGTVIMETIEVGLHQNILITAEMLDVHLTKDAESCWQITSRVLNADVKLNINDNFYLVETGVFKEYAKLCFKMSVKQVINACNIDIVEVKKMIIAFECILYFCENDSQLCKMKAYKCHIPLEITEGSEVKDDLPVNITIKNE